jgi:hypothetical protein
VLGGCGSSLMQGAAWVKTMETTRSHSPSLGVALPTGALIIIPSASRPMWLAADAAEGMASVERAIRRGSHPDDRSTERQPSLPRVPDPALALNLLSNPPKR